MTGRRRIERGAHVRHRLQLLILDRDMLRGILGHGAAGRHDGRDRLALPADAIDRDGAVAARISDPSNARARRPRA